MELILIENVQNLGRLGDVVNVKPGFGRNFLVPQGKAVPATDKNRMDFETRRAGFEAKAAERLTGAEQRRAAVADKVVTIAAKASSEGKLYGSVGTREIADALTQAGLSVDKSEVVLSDGPIRQVGEHSVQVHFYTEVDCTVTLIVESEDG